VIRLSTKTFDTRIFTNVVFVRFIKIENAFASAAHPVATYTIRANKIGSSFYTIIDFIRLLLRESSKKPRVSGRNRKFGSVGGSAPSLHGTYLYEAS